MIQQFIVNGLIAGSTYAFIALSFALIYSVARFFHFAHGAVCALGAYACYGLNVWLGFPLWTAVPLAIIICCALGLIMEKGLYHPLRKRGASPLVLLLASLGLYIVLENLIALLFGNETRILRTALWGRGDGRQCSHNGGSDSDCDHLLDRAGCDLDHAPIDRDRTDLRAVSGDPDLARILGVRSWVVNAVAFVVGSGMAGLASILVALDIDMRPTMGLWLLLPGVVAMIVGGTGSVPGALVGGLILGLVQHLGVWAIGARWQDAIAFVVLVLCLAIRPWGIFGRPTARAAI